MAYDRMSELQEKVDMRTIYSSLEKDLVDQARLIKKDADVMDNDEDRAVHVLNILSQPVYFALEGESEDLDWAKEKINQAIVLAFGLYGTKDPDKVKRRLESAWRKNELSKLMKGWSPFKEMKK